MTELVELNIDLRAGTIGIRAGTDGVSAILDRVEALLEKFWTHTSPIQAVGTYESVPPLAADTAPPDATTAGNGAPKQEVASKRSGGRGTSKRVNWNINELGLNADKRKLLKDQFEGLQPKTQNEQVAVVAVILKELLKISEFDGHAIASGLRIAGAKIPGNLGAVFGNMRAEHLIDLKEGKLVVTAFLEDFVRDIPTKNAKKNTK